MQATPKDVPAATPRAANPSPFLVTAAARNRLQESLFVVGVVCAMLIVTLAPYLISVYNHAKHATFAILSDGNDFLEGRT